MRVSRNSKYIIPYLEKFYEVTSYYSYSLIRFVAGVMMVPHLVRAATRGDAVLHTSTPTPLREVLAPDVARTLLGMLEATMTTGTGRKYFQGKKGPRLGSVRAGLHPVRARAVAFHGTHANVNIHVSRTYIE